MRLSRLFVPTLREDPAEAEIASHRLLLRAGFIRQVAAGIYTALPLGLRSMRKIEAIVREEMDASGAQEIRMPIVLPAEPWKRTGRYELYGEVLFRLLRVREFRMKDAYSFDRDEAGLRRSYEVMFDAYRRVFDRFGIDHVIVEAEPGQIGGGLNHEFMARATVGEDLFVECANGDYLADLKAATPVGGRSPSCCPATARSRRRSSSACSSPSRSAGSRMGTSRRAGTRRGSSVRRAWARPSRSS